MSRPWKDRVKDTKPHKKILGWLQRKAGIPCGLLPSLAAIATAIMALSCLIGCHREEAKTSGPLSQRGYLWQREWTPAVAEAMVKAEEKLDGVVILGAEIHWQGKMPKVIRSSIPWDFLRATKKASAVALRVAPFSGPFATDDEPIRIISQTAASLLSEAKEHGVNISEFQLDFDCADRNLAGYRVWLQSLRPVVKPARFVITTLPSWLDERVFSKLVGEVDGFVLQVHSVPTEKESGRAALCDPVLARKWVSKAARLNRPFAVALPTYWCVAGYNPAGKLLGIAMDSVQPAWPSGTNMLEFSTDADALADLVGEWQKERPLNMTELLWYRVPVATDARNWRWPTLAAVMAGRRPMHRLEGRIQNENPVDVAIANSGEADEILDQPVTVSWDDAKFVSSDALAGWEVQEGTNRAVFAPGAGRRLRLSPGDQRDIGWIRYDRITTPRCKVSGSDSVHH